MQCHALQMLERLLTCAFLHMQQDKGRLLLSLFFSEEAGSDPSPQQRVVLIRLAEGKNKELADLVTQHAPQ